ncbi:hypothetical protein [Streptomyces sp. NPDC101150]|uniref:hypothetical protein n=1 Tax=Streptomyces sp. NPDC101150 TaxID=3366114 RepID=UPI0037FD70B6
MHEDGTDARGLFHALHEHDGPETYGTVVLPWLEKAAGDYRASLARAAVYEPWRAGDTTPQASPSLTRELYALSRVSDVLLLGFQPAADAPSEWPSADRHRSPGQWPGVSLSEYLELFGALGMAPFDDTEFDPFLHEIVEVEQADEPETPIQITQVVWPGLMLGDLLFSRAGVRVRAGSNHAQRGVADRFPLYWTFWRRYRPTIDESHGWGHNSQWATDFRLDYRTSTAVHLNVAGETPRTGAGEFGEEATLLTPGERSELLRHRCLLRAPDASDELAELPGWEKDLAPFGWRLPNLGE